MARLERIAIVGASLAGLRAAESLRALGYGGALLVVGAEKHLPYDRPPLSKEILQGRWDVDRIGLRKQPYGELGLDLRLGVRATALDVAARELVLADGARERFDALVIATGSSPRRLRDQPELDGLHLLRSLDDALAIRAALERRPRVAGGRRGLHRRRGRGLVPRARARGRR